MAEWLEAIFHPFVNHLRLFNLISQKCFRGTRISFRRRKKLVCVNTKIVYVKKIHNMHSMVWSIQERLQRKRSKKCLTRNVRGAMTLFWVVLII